MKAFLRTLIDKLPYIRKLRSQVEDAGAFPAGHYYSPIPDREETQRSSWSELLQQEASRASTDPRIELPGIRLNEEEQFRVLTEFSKHYGEVPFPEQQTPGCRYYYGQHHFCYADAIFLYCFLRHAKPKRIVEIGSGFSSAVILDTVERCFDPWPEISFVEPDAARVKAILSPQDLARIRLLETKVQDLPREALTSLQAGDLLFVDSTHVVKFGSDVQFLMFEVLPRLSPGVFVHFHDIFYPFEYPGEWLRRGIYWNESYFLRSFLTFNSEWDIFYFNTYVARRFHDFIKEKMPLCLKNTGASMYIQRRGPWSPEAHK